MTIPDARPLVSGAATAPRSSAATQLLDVLTRREFARLPDVLDDRVRFRALLPGGPQEWVGAQAVAEQFTRWFGGRESVEVVAADTGDVADRVQLRWRLRVRSAELGPGWFVVEQRAYADTTASGSIAALDLLCSGFRAEASDA